ncbi:MAG: hypothetical protein ABI193_08375 [Minicystis sp.]
MRPRADARLALFLVLAALVPACGSSERGGDSAWSNESQEKYRPLRQTEALNGPTRAEQAANQGALLGVRHDLMLTAAAHPARCNCLAVEVGPAGGSPFFWTGAGPPEIGGEALAIAVSANGVECLGGDPNGQKRRPSISAVDLENDDVLVEIEDLPEGRPLATGAIIPKPGPKGSVYVRPQNARVIYAKGAFAGRCKVR